MNKTLLILVLVLILQYRADLSNNLQAYFPLGDLSDASGNSRTLIQSTTSLISTMNKDGVLNKAYQTTTAPNQYLETELFFITADFTISIWTKSLDSIPLNGKYPTLFSILFNEEQNDGIQNLEVINFTSEFIFGNYFMHVETNKYLISSQKWEMVSFIRKDNEFYYYTSSKGYHKVQFTGGIPLKNIGNFPLKLRIGDSFKHIYSYHGTDYSYIGIMSDLRIHSRALEVSELLEISYPNYVDYQLNEIQVAHYPLNKNLKEINSQYSRLKFHTDDQGNEIIKGRSTFDRYKYFTSAIDLDNGGNLSIPKETIQGRQSFTISFYVFGIDVENFTAENQAIFLEFFNESSGIVYFSFSNNNYIVDNVSRSYQFQKKILDGKWNHIVFSVDGSTQEAKLYINQEWQYDIISTANFADLTTSLTLAYLPNVAANANPGFLKLDDLRIFNTALTDYQIVDVYSLSSAYGQEQYTDDEMYLFRFDNNQFSELELPLYQGDTYPVFDTNAQYAKVNFGDKIVTAAHGPEVKLSVKTINFGQTELTLSMWVLPKDFSNTQSSSKIMTLNFGYQKLIEIFFDHFTAFGIDYTTENLFNQEGWQNLVLKVQPYVQLISLNGYVQQGVVFPSETPLFDITAYGNEYYFTNFLYYSYGTEDNTDVKNLNYQQVNPRFNDKLEEDTVIETPDDGSSTDPVDPPTDPVDPPTTPVNDINQGLQAHFPLGHDNDISGNSRTLVQSSIGMVPTQNYDNQPNRAYETTDIEQYLETDLSYITGDFSISLWTKFSEGTPYPLDQYPTLLSILFESQGGDNDLELINFSAEYITANYDMHIENNKYMLRSQEWEFVSFIRKDAEFYYYTSNKGLKKINFLGPFDAISNPTNLPLKLRLGYTFDNQYKQQYTKYSYSGIFSDLRIHNRALEVSELHGISFANFVDYHLDDIQIAHYPLNKNLKEVDSKFSRLTFYAEQGDENIQGRSAFDRDLYYTSAVSIDNGGNLIIPKEIFQGLQSFTISFYVFGVDVFNDGVNNQASFLDFYNFDSDKAYFGFMTNGYIVDSYPKFYSIENRILDGNWNHILFTVDGSAQQAEFCINFYCEQQPISTANFVEESDIISLAYLPEAEANTNPGFLKVDELRIFNTVLTDYQRLDVSNLNSAFGQEKLVHEMYVFRLDNNQYSELEVQRPNGETYPVIEGNAQYARVQFGNSIVTAAHGPEINLSQYNYPFGQTEFSLSIWVLPKNFGELGSNSKVLRIDLSNNQYIDLYFDRLNIFGTDYTPGVIFPDDDWVNIVLKVSPFTQQVSFNEQSFDGIPFSHDTPLHKITAYGDEFYFTNFIYYGFPIDYQTDVKNRDYVLAHPTFNDKLEEDAVDPPTDPVDPPTDPVDPPTDPVDPPTDPVDPPTDPVDPPTDPVDPPTDPVDPDVLCYQLLEHLDPSKFDIQFELKLQHGEYYHNYDIFYTGFENDVTCFDTKILIGSKVATFIESENHHNIIFPHLLADQYGCDKPTDTNTQCKFEIEISFKGQVQAIRYFTSVVNTPNLQDVSKDLTYGVQIDTYEEGEDSVIDQTLDTNVGLCTDETCSEYKNSLDLPKGEVAYLEFKVQTPGYSSYYPIHVSFKMNNIDVPLENQSELDNWQEQGRIVYKFIPLISGQTIKLAVKVNLSKDNPHALRRLEELEQERKNIGDHVYIRVTETEDQNNNNNQNLQQKGNDNNKKDDDNTVLFLVMGGAVVLSIVSISTAVVCYKLKFNNKKLERSQKYKESPSQDGKDLSIVDQQSLSIAQSSNNINESRQELNNA